VAGAHNERRQEVSAVPWRPVPPRVQSPDTTVSQLGEEIGRMAVDLLLELTPALGATSGTGVVTPLTIVGYGPRAILGKSLHRRRTGRAELMPVRPFG
jgi:hypothetical protein